MHIVALFSRDSASASAIHSAGGRREEEERKRNRGVHIRPARLTGRASARAFLEKCGGWGESVTTPKSAEK